ncbi:hypothetical protein [Sutterella wadsworthensis]|uniref:hypothetical protein n=1 Tax=Sutterella wadsworthensis TaxID=40545 RepID=UPI003AB94DCE
MLKTIHLYSAPNITGKFGASKADSQIISGAFLSINGLTGATGKQDSANQFSFDASSSDSTFGRSSGVQPPAMALLPCIKI